MADRERPIVEQLPFAGQRVNVHAAVVVPPTAFVHLAGAAQLIVRGGTLAATAPLCVRRQQPIGQGTFLAACTQLCCNRAWFFCVDCVVASQIIIGNRERGIIRNC